MRKSSIDAFCDEQEFNEIHHVTHFNIILTSLMSKLPISAYFKFWSVYQSNSVEISFCLTIYTFHSLVILNEFDLWNYIFSSKKLNLTYFCIAIWSFFLTVRHMKNDLFSWPIRPYVTSCLTRLLKLVLSKKKSKRVASTLR